MDIGRGTLGVLMDTGIGALGHGHWKMDTGRGALGHGHWEGYYDIDTGRVQ